MVALIEQPNVSEAGPVPLTMQERVRLGQLIRTVERGLSQFLAVGAALLELRSSRLYRETHDTFESFCRETFGLARSTTDQVIRSASTAQLLIDSGVELPATTTEATIRPVASLPAALQPVGWQLIQAVSPKCGPTQPIAAKVVRTIRNAIEPAGDVGNNGHKRSRSHPSRELAFVGPVTRLASYHGFDANLATSHVEKFSSALSVFTACRIMADRCLTCCDILSKKFPELTDA